MRLDIEQPISEVAMNPSSFAAALESAQTDKVRVGFEFEVCIPGVHITNIAQQKIDTETRRYHTERSIADYAKDSQFLSLEIYIYNIKQFSQIFSIRPGVSKYSSVLDGLHAYIDTQIKKCHKIFNSMPSDAREQSYDTGYPLQRYIDSMVAGYRNAHISVAQISRALDELEHRLDAGDSDEIR